jgi:hypothetical protein
MTTLDRFAIAQQFHRNVQVSRAQIFGGNDPVPLHLREDAETMFAGYVGPDYKPGGVVLLAINPGGGGDAYSYRTPEDQRLYPLLRAFKSATPENAFPIFERINDELARVINSWNLRKIVMPTIEAAGVRFSEICYLNAVPYRTREDRLPSVAAKKSAWSLVVAPTLRLIQPKAVIALGMKAGDALSRNHSGAERAYVVPRSIGDSRITPDAQVVLNQIRQDFHTGVGS